ncbi:dehydrogenase/reductase SDR family member on chromosome X [Scaptodrosophila lebanonensis]|uniref:Dehydrogenase/reductase SDR family member on chromosome X n=1 Tax=Drosophila lebanonensis TaxID=7225 RepID=A0A6J2TII5_DROLE|nr:dehydrogenase/reductase SDR family member on chromosome X [Scaptodrosophila lebanonensis]XP_030375254.1 dehydrogenase/reductase SDR family member on chromosome X [Scaptodrosophila lebanonensis]XP_030375255.1 dehydrogenase/reductase SDR family member on chromosome X [Scaptodrosophila lebanonensis]
MLGTLFTLALLALMLCGFIFSKTTKGIPKSWYEWKTEFRYQYMGIVGLIHDAQYAKRDRVALYKQPDRIAVITGGNRGIGLRIVEKLLACDMTVIMGVRDPQSAEAAVRSIVDISQSSGKLICEQLDVGDLKSVRAFAQRIKEKYTKIDLLLNNAGIMFAPFRLTADGYESHFAINYLGHFLLTHLLLPQLKASGRSGRNSRIVNVSSCVNLIGRINYKDINGLKYYYPGTAYSQSKLAQILFTRHLQHLLDEQQAPVQVNVVHPGIVDTDLFEHSATTSVPFMKKLFFKTPERGARTVVYAAIDPAIEGQGGTYLSNCGKGPMHGDAKKPEKCEKFFKYSCDLLNIKQYGNGEN